MRTIKPEFWDSPSTAKADLAVRLTYIAMWNWADDSGRGTANLKELEAFCFPNDEISSLPRASAGASGDRRGNSAHSSGSWRNFAEVCGEVAEVYGIKFYKVHDRPYYVIPNFREHQAKDFREKSKYPKEDEGYFFDITSGNAINERGEEESSAGTSGDRRGISAHEAGKKSLVIGEQGKNTCSSDDEHGGSKTEVEPEPTNRYPDAFEDWWNLYPRKQAKRKALNEWRRATKRINREELNQRTQAFATFHETEGTDKQFIPLPTTWLTRDGWEDELIPRRLANQQAQQTTNSLDAWLPPNQSQVVDGEIVEQHDWTSKGELPW
ncbi:hypothetical protein [uncultured Corynebacterium sp.]|uniref:hypothetical protein n=1 Tax=uncultured Corynebacterium sp. TaxID=159447 RepID=UPI00280588D1|nr:hypothetical protein [uncultured Corynebacterium sp.]